METEWEIRQSRIAMRYIKGWFFLDVFSVVPSAFDVVRLAYSLSTYVAVADARETVARLGNDDIVVEEPNRKLCAAALACFFAEQRDDGTWPPGQAIFLRSRRSFDVGNAYVFFVDVLATVLGCGLPHATLRDYG